MKEALDVVPVISESFTASTTKPGSPKSSPSASAKKFTDNSDLIYNCLWKCLTASAPVKCAAPTLPAAPFDGRHDPEEGMGRCSRLDAYRRSRPVQERTQGGDWLIKHIRDAWVVWL